MPAIAKGFTSGQRTLPNHMKYKRTETSTRNRLIPFAPPAVTSQVVRAGRKLDLSDLERDPVVVFQRKHHSLLALFMCFMLPGALPHLAWGEPFWNGVWVAGAFRYVVCLHATWLVNSAAHFFGHRQYDEHSWPGENAVVSALTIGEGWHNW